MTEPILIDIEKLFSDDVVRSLVIRDLESIYNFNMGYLKKYKENDGSFIAVFSTDPVEDQAQLEAFTQALAVVLEYYGVDV